MNGRVSHEGSVCKDRRLEEHWDEPDVPDGCQWAKSCEGCPWPDCVLKGPRYAYSSPQAQKIRGNMIVGLWEAGVSPKELMALFRISQMTVYKVIEDTNLIGTFRAQRNEKIVRARREGRSARELAGEFGLNEGTVRRILREAKKEGMEV